jgi:hypothetical protein
MTAKLSIQAVSGAIRATKGINVSARTTGRKSRSYRTTGVYAEVRPVTNDIKLGFWTKGYSTMKQDAETDIPKVIATLESKGFKVVRKSEPFGFNTNHFEEVLIVEVA